MSSCLGLYIEENLIKYAKVTKEKDDLKIEAFGVKFYDNIGPAIEQIIAETYSYKTPISINLSDEAYNYFYFFNLLNKNDLKKAVELEFESYCFDKGYNRNAIESRYTLIPDLEDKEKIKAIYISTNKIEINRKLQELEKYTVTCIAPLPLAIANVTQLKTDENVAIINLEEKTSLTSIINGSIYNVDILENTPKDILDKISEKENSYSKAYEICKNTTIYTMEGRGLQEEENMYLQDIMPTLYEIVLEIKKILDDCPYRIDKIYITGTGSSINNIDLYFQEYFNNIKCEMLKPYFIPQTVKINVKDYIEVNSAIALAMQALDYGTKNINFKTLTLRDRMPEFLKKEVGLKTKKGLEKENNTNKEKSKLKLPKLKFKFEFDLGEKLDKVERWLLRTSIGLVSLVTIYAIISSFVVNQIDSKSVEIQEVESYTNKQISAIQSDVSKINSATTKYQDMKKNLEELNSSIAEENSYKNIIPNLLINIQSYIPQGVTLTSIENTTGRHIVINAQSERYDLLGYFKGVIQSKGILDPSSVISTSGVKQNNLVKIVIEGDMP